jgi:hypothetical protein
MLTNFKKRSALLVSLAVICATVSLVPSTAGAAGTKVPNAGTTTPSDPYTAPSNDAITTACPMSSAPAAGFSDTTSTDVDCIKMFGITQGTTATTYEPDASIPRWQMALFLHRMFVPMGVAAAGTTTVPSFTDTAGLSAEIQAAITAIASHGVTLGTTATTFGPDDNVTREQMAMFLHRLGKITKPYNSATVTDNGIFADNASDIASGAYNFSDIAGTTFEGMEAIIALYNIGATGETCTAATATTCSTSYRPAADITRGEMATMIKSVLDHSNARPAGCTMQNTQALAAGGGAETTSISCRNADFTPQLNTTVDEFWQVRNDTSATTAALSVPFNALSGLVSTAGGTGVAGTGTVGTVDAGDRITNALGNAAGQGCAVVAASTCRHWIHTGDQGTIYINGSTDGFLWEGGLAATATPSAYATTMTSAIDKAALSATCNFGGAGNALGAAVSATDGECAYQGTSRTITTTLTGASTAAIVDGYTVKYIDKVVNYGGGTGQMSVTFNTTYVATSAGVATLTVTCAADHLPLASNAADDGAPAIAEYFESHEVIVDLGTAALGTGYPTGGADITGGNIVGNTDISCDDVPRAYSDTYQTISVNQNYQTTSTAGTLATASVTTHDQYGDGIGGVLVQFDTDTLKNLALTAEGTTDTARSMLLTNSDGVAAYSGVVCDAASVGTSGVVSFRIHDQGGSPEASTTAAVAPAAGVVEGSNIYCTQAASDTVTVTTENKNVTSADETQTIRFVLNSDGTTLADPAAGNFTCTYDGEAGDELAHDSAHGAIAAAMNSNDNLTGLVVTALAGGDANKGFNIAFAANTGAHPQITCAEKVGALLAAGDGTAHDIVMATTLEGVHGVTLDLVDHDAAAGVIVAKRTVENRTAAGAAVLETHYLSYSYDDTDVFNTAATAAATRTQFETALNAVANLTTNLDVVYRTGALTTGVSSLTIG